jgi:HAD superfamily hydrolase (TIGR01549 family)
VKFMFLAAVFLYGVTTFIKANPVNLNSNKQTVVILDLGKVVLFADKKKAFKSFQMKDVVRFMMFHGMPNENKLFDCLYSLYGKDENSEMPACLRPWLTGQCDGNQLCDDICLRLNDSNLTTIQKNFVKSSVQNMRTDKLAEIHYLDKKAAKFICELLNSVDADGQPIKVVILSNWDKASFDLVRQKFNNLFDLIGDENIVVSGHVGLMKPDVSIYQYTLNKYHLSPEQCFFVDDTKENVNVAKSCGIKSVRHKDWSKTESKLKKLGLSYQTQSSSSTVKEQALACM